MKISKHPDVIKFWPVICIIAAWLVFAGPYFVKGLAPFPSRYLVTFFPPWSAMYGMPVKNNAMPDVMTQIYPWKKITMDIWKNTAVPLWNPYSFSGTVHAANVQTAVFSPFNILFILLPQIEAWSVLVLLQPLLAGLFMYLFLRELDLTPYAGLLGSLAFMFCGFLVVWMAYATLGYAILWLPLILWAIHRSFREPSWWSLITVTLGVAFSYFSGHFQISTYAGGLSFVYLIFELLSTKRYKRGFVIVIFFLLGFLLSLPQLLPAAVAYYQSVRSTLFTGGNEIIPWQYLVTLFAPDFYGNPVTRNDWFGHYAEWASFIGTVPLFFAIYSIIRRKTGQQWFFLGSAVTALFLAFPTPLADIFFQAKIPALSTSAGSRIIVLFSFSCAVLSGFGLDGLINDWKSRNKKTLYIFALFIVMLLAAIWLALTFFKVLPVDKLMIARRNLMLPTATAIVAVALFVFGFLVKKKLLQDLLIIFLIAVTAFEMLRYATKWMPFDPKEYIFPQTDVAAFLHASIGNYRLFGNVGNEFTGFNSFQSIEGYDALYQARYGEFVSAAYDGKFRSPERSVVNIQKHGQYTEKILELLGVKFIMHRLSDGRMGWTYPYWIYPNYTSVYKDKYYEILENASVYPRAFLVSSFEILTKDQEILNRLFSEDFNLKDSVILEERPIINPQTGLGTVTIENYQPESVRMTTDSNVPKLLFLSDAYDAGWQATIDGKKTPVYRADYDFRAVAVPAGKHTVEFRYSPMSFRIGLFAAAAVILFLVLGSLKRIFI